MAGNYHSTVILNDGRELGFKWLGRGDMAGLLALGGALEPSELSHLSLNLTNSQSLQSSLDAGEAAPRRILGAADPEQGGMLAGCAYLKLGQEAHAHMALVETMLHPDFHNLGLGSGLLREIIGYTTSEGIHLLRMEIHLDDKDLIGAVKRLGFEPKAIMEDFRVDSAGVPYDAIILIKRLQYSSNKEFLYRY